MVKKYIVLENLKNLCGHISVCYFKELLNLIKYGDKSAYKNLLNLLKFENSWFYTVLLDGSYDTYSEFLDDLETNRVCFEIESLIKFLNEYCFCTKDYECLETFTREVLDELLEKELW